VEVADEKLRFVVELRKQTCEATCGDINEPRDEGLIVCHQETANFGV